MKIIPLFVFVTCIHIAGFSVPEEIQVQYDAISGILSEADTEYFEHHNSLMSDEAYDHFRSYLNILTQQFPELHAKGPDAVNVPDRSRVKHRQPVLSLKKAYSDEEIFHFCDRLGWESGFVVEPKIDGVSVVLIYQNGILAQALTRGDSLSGIDITRAVIATNSLKVVLENVPSLLVLRGEVYVTKERFKELNQLQQQKNRKNFSSARHLVAGSLMLNDYNEIKNRGLKISIFEWLNALEMGYSEDDTALNCLMHWGLPVVKNQLVLSKSELVEVIPRLVNSRSLLPYDTDGWVIKINDLRERNVIGETKKYPRWAIARKYHTQAVVTTVRMIELSTSEKGKITPVAILDPVEVNGVTIRRASLHNEEFASKMGIQPGVKVKVIRAGGAVPEIVGIVND